MAVTPGAEVAAGAAVTSDAGAAAGDRSASAAVVAAGAADAAVPGAGDGFGVASRRGEGVGGDTAGTDGVDAISGVEGGPVTDEPRTVGVTGTSGASPPDRPPHPAAVIVSTAKIAITNAAFAPGHRPLPAQHRGPPQPHIDIPVCRIICAVTPNRSGPGDSDMGGQ